MARLHALALLVACLSSPACAAALSCPIEQVAAQIVRIDGHASNANVRRGGQQIAAVPDMCLLYGDRVEASDDVKVEINTGDGRQKMVGGLYDPVWSAPQPRGEISSDFAAALSIVFANILSPARNRVVYTTGRGASASCEQNTRPVLTRLGRLSLSRQKIGADLRSIGIGWNSSATKEHVTVLLRRGRDRIVAQASSCGENHLAITFPPGAIAPGDKLVLELGRAGHPALRYDLDVVAPSVLPRPEAEAGEDWLLGAWRLAAADPETTIDALSRVQAAPRDALAAQRILQAVWTEQPF